MLSTQKTLSVLILTFSLALLNFAQADDSPKHQIQFEHYETLEVTPDVLRVSFKALGDGNSSQEVTQQLNTAMQQAVRSLNKYPQLKLKTEHLQVYPVRDRDRKITHWQGSQSLQVLSPLSAENETWLKQVQSLLSYDGMGYQVSEALQKESQTILLHNALKNYQQHAKQIAKAFDEEFKLTKTKINAQPNRAYAPPMMMRAAVAAESIPAPAISEGTTTLTLTISGTLELDD